MGRVMQDNTTEGEGLWRDKNKKVRVWNNSTSLSMSDEATDSKEPTTITSLNQYNF